MKSEIKSMAGYGFGLGAVALGILLDYTGMGTRSFGGFGSLGSWMVYVGFMLLFITTLRLVLKPKKKVVDERMEFVAAKAMRVTYVFFVALAFVLMVYDGLNPITVPVHILLSFLVCAMLLAYFVSYKLLLRSY